MRVQEQDLLQEKSTSQLLRVVHKEPGRFWVMRIGTRTRHWPERVSAEHLEGSGLFCRVEPSTRCRTSKAAWAHADAVYLRFSDVLDDPITLLTAHGRSKALALCRERDPTLQKSVYYKVLWRWLSGGQNRLALVDTRGRPPGRLSVKGLKEISYAFAVSQTRARCERLMTQTVSPARPRSDHIRTGQPRRRRECVSPTRFRVDKCTLRVFLHFMKKEFPLGTTLQARYEAMLDEIYSTATPTGQQRWPPDAVPSARQFENWYYELTTYRQRRIAKTGEHDWDLNQRSRLGRQISAAFCAGSVGSLDATVWNVELVGTGPLAPLLGPPIVFRIRCKDCAMLLGLSVSLDSACWMSAASAIANCIEDKPQFCHALTVPCRHDDWPICGLPGCIEADCGETANRKPHAFVALTGTELRNLPPGRGDLKGGVEGDFFVLQTSLNGKTPGAIIEEYRQKTQKAWRVQARLTLPEFTAMLVAQELLKMYTLRPTLKLLPEMIEKDVNTSPISMWNYSVKYCGGGLRSVAEDRCRLSLLDVDSGSITDHGLLFKGLLYESTELGLTYAYEKARAGRRKLLDIAFDPRLVDTVYIIQGNRERPDDYLPCQLNRDRVDQRRLAGRSFREVAVMLDLQTEAGRLHDIETRPLKAAWTQTQRDIVIRASARVDAIRATSDVSDSALMKGRPAAREAERNATSPKMALVPPLPAPGAESTHATTPSSTTVSQALASVVPVRARSASKATRLANRAAAVVSMSNDTTIDSGEPNDADHQ